MLTQEQREEITRKAIQINVDAVIQIAKEKKGIETPVLMLNILGNGLQEHMIIAKSVKEASRELGYDEKLVLEDMIGELSSEKVKDSMREMLGMKKDSISPIKDIFKSMGIKL